MPVSSFGNVLRLKKFPWTTECPEFCLHKSELRPCPAKCECAYVREIIQVIKDWPKKKRDESQ